MTYVLWPDQTGSEGELGGKARALADLQRARLPIPAWFVLTPIAFYESLTFAQRTPFETGDVRAAATVLRSEMRFDAAPMAALDAALARLCADGAPVAVRSSASDEDGVAHSFAGQFDSFLFVPASTEAVVERVIEVWRSAFSQRALAYREQACLPGMPQPPSVLIQRMVCADRSGVAFGADPVSGRRSVAVVAAVWGLGTSLVSGECDADTYHVDRSGEISLRTIAVKLTAHLASPGSPEGVEAVPVPDAEAKRAVLSDDQIRSVADLVRRVGRHSGQPRDIEWAIEEGRLYLLQSRPITALAALPDPDGSLCLWDNSNIAESYNGVTTPLTFSFARRAYAEVYRQMCRTLGVPVRTIQANDEVFRNMLGLMRGRVYYNLLNWYKLLTLLPGFTSNRVFMEQMMGVREGIPDDLAASLKSAGRGEKLWDRLRMTGTFAGILLNYLCLPAQIERFHADLNDALATPSPPLEAMRSDELADLYREMEQRLLTHWDPPLVNDLFAMIFYGLLGKLTERWCGDTNGMLRNDLVRGKGGMISAEPALRVREMADSIAADAEMSELLRGASTEKVLDAMASRPALRARYQSYLEKFGDRCIEELKLESPTLNDDPTPLHRAIGRLVGEKPYPRMAQIGADKNTGLPPPISQIKSTESASAVDSVFFLRRPLFKWVLRNAQRRVRDRENLRFERTRLFGRVRQIFVEIGKRFAADGLLDTPRDIFYLEVQEVLGFIQGTATCTDLKGLVGLRMAEFERYREMTAPDDRFETRGAVYVNPFRGAAALRPPDSKPGSVGILKGLGCCPGVVKARARVILDPRGAEISPGSILVAQRTDPGWVMLFPAAAGLLVEHGSLLSHSAIVAREMGIPAIVSINGLTSQIEDGELLEMDGGAGTVRRLGRPQEAASPVRGTNVEPQAVVSQRIMVVEQISATVTAAPPSAPPTSEPSLAVSGDDHAK